MTRVPLQPYAAGDHVEILYGKPDETRWVPGVVSWSDDEYIDVMIDDACVTVRRHQRGRIRMVTENAGDA